MPRNPASHALAARAFTLVELLVVIAITAVLLGILLPALSGTRNSARVASTKAMITTVDAAVKSFRAEKGRLPGAFTVAELGDAQNNTSADAENPNITCMENALLELVGGIVPEDPGTATSFSIMLGDHQVWIERGLIGAKDGPSYLNIGESLAAIAGQYGQNDHNGTVNHPIPDVIDPFGQPIMMWARDEYVDHSATFAEIDSSIPAEFYWTSNASYVNSQSLGKNNINQGTASLLCQELDTEDRKETLTAVCGNPGLPDLDGPVFRPAAARGDVVFQAVGIDEIFLNRGNDGSATVSPIKKAVYIGGLNPSDVQSRLGLTADDASWAPIESFDDIILGGG